ncbi:hypothetical protein [Deinococcus sp.]|uniref:hypothetical protein n=1 Tax=Deinococcus sp. TaxID=47478 RepID=UPI0025BF4194|nr:hypothetical protein [Deinococcus sp.]
MRRLWFSLGLPLALSLCLSHTAAVNLTKSGTLPSSPTSTSCSGVFTDREVFGDVQVPPNRNCTLNNTAVHGNLLLAQGSSLIVKDSNVQGSLKTDAGFVRVALSGAIVGGQLDAGQGGSVTLNDSQVVGKVNIYRNTGNVRINRMTVNSDLNCWGNRTEPAGTWVRVDGVQTGQCRRL